MRVEAARSAVDEGFTSAALVSEVIELLRTDKNLDAEELRVAIEIAAARGDNPEQRADP
jgi:hypothetical protein